MMADDEASTRLQKIWDIFFHAETGTYEKSLWLDLLLAEFLLQLKNGTDISDLLSFCPLGGVTTLIGCELLCGIHCVTSVYGHCSKKFDCQTNCDNRHFNPFVYKTDLDDFIKNETVDNHPFSENIQQAANFPSSSGIDQSLHKYVLKGAAWRCLALLQILGVKGLSCHRQLSRILIWLYGELCSVTSTSREPNQFLPLFEDKPQIQELFCNRIWGQRKNFLIEVLYLKDSMAFKNRNKTPSNASSNRKKHRKMSRSRVKHNISKKSKANVFEANAAHSSDSQDFDDLEKMNRSFASKIKYSEKDYESLTSAMCSEGEISRNCIHVKSMENNKLSIKKFMTDKHTEVLNSEISLYEFNLLVINLLYRLCSTETVVSKSDAFPINMQCITFTIKNLWTLQFESSPATAVSMDSVQVSNLKFRLTELLMISLNKVLMYPDLFGKIISNGVLPMLLRLLEDITFKLNMQLNEKSEDETLSQQFKEKVFLNKNFFDTNEVDNLLKYLFGITYSVLMFLYCFMMEKRSIDSLNNFIEQFKLFSDCRKGLLVNESINIMLRLPSTDNKYAIILVKKLIILIGRFIVGMKQVRCAVTHSMKCLRNQHELCYYKLIINLHHHKDIFETNDSSDQSLILSHTCCVATLYNILATLLTDTYYISNNTLLTKLLKCMKNCGSCCCFSPKILIETVINIIITNKNCTNFCFSLLEHTLYGELGVIKYNNDESNCVVCKRYFNEIDAMYTDKRSRQTSETALSSTIYSKPKIIWPFLTKYNCLFDLDDCSLVNATMGHLLKMSSISNNSVKHDLIFCVFYPTFVMAKDQYLSVKSESSFFIIMSCLRLFLNLLSLPVFMIEFIQKGGLIIVLELITIEDLFKPCLMLLEIATNIEIYQFEQDKKLSSELVDFMELQFLTSIQILFKSSNNIIDKALKYFIFKMDIDTFKRVTDISAILSKMNLKDKQFLKKKFSSYVNKTYPINIQRANISSRSSDDTATENQMLHLKKMELFWKTCVSLCVHCPLFRKYFCTCTAFEDLYIIMKLILYNIHQIDTTEIECSCMIKMLESVVTVGLVLSVFHCVGSRFNLNRRYSENGFAMIALKLNGDRFVQKATEKPRSWRVHSAETSIQVKASTLTKKHLKTQ